MSSRTAYLVLLFAFVSVLAFYVIEPDTGLLLEYLGIERPVSTAGSNNTEVPVVKKVESKSRSTTVTTKKKKSSKKKKTTTKAAEDDDYTDDDEWGAQIDPESYGKLEYKDERIPDFRQIQEPDYKDTKLSWTSEDGRHQFTITLYIDRYMYEYYHSLSRYTQLSDYQNYIDDENNKEIISELTDSLKNLGNKNGYDTSQIAREAVRMVQSIPYVTDPDSAGQDDFPKYPLETLYDYGGDCEDTSFLLAAIFKELNYGCCLIAYDDHLAVGIKGSNDMPGAYFEKDGVKYYYVETTGENWEIGVIPDEQSGQSAKIVVIV